MGNERFNRALRAMKTIGLSSNAVSPVLKRLLKLYNNEWELIEGECYRVLADAVFENDEELEEEEEELEEQVKKSKRKRKNCNLVVDSDSENEDEGEVQNEHEYVPPLTRARSVVVTRVVRREREREPEPEPSGDKCIGEASPSSTSSRKRCTPPKKKSKAEPEVVVMDSKRKLVEDEKGKRIANEGPSSTAMPLALPPPSPPPSPPPPPPPPPPQPQPQTLFVLKKPKIEDDLEVDPNSAITCFGTPIVEEKSMSTEFEGESEAGLPKKQNEHEDGENRSLGIINVAPIAAVNLDFSPHQNAQYVCDSEGLQKNEESHEVQGHSEQGIGALGALAEAYMEMDNDEDLSSEFLSERPETGFSVINNIGNEPHLKQPFIHYNSDLEGSGHMHLCLEYNNGIEKSGNMQPSLASHNDFEKSGHELGCQEYVKCLHVPGNAQTNFDDFNTGVTETDIPRLVSTDRVLKMIEAQTLQLFNILLPKFPATKLMETFCQQFLKRRDSQICIENHTQAVSVATNLLMPNDKVRIRRSPRTNQKIGESPVSIEDNDHAESRDNAGTCTTLINLDPCRVDVEQSRPMHDLKDISRGEEIIPIPIVNELSSESFPTRFQYIQKSIVYQNAYVNVSLARIGDDDCCSNCSGNCLESPITCACARETGGEYAYTRDGTLKKYFIEDAMSLHMNPKQHQYFYCKDCPIERTKNECKPDPCKGHSIRKFIKECWSKCGCNKQCGNRVVQRGITFKLQVFLTPEGKGWGVRTLEEIPRGAFVCEYVGEILTNTELYNRNNERMRDEKHHYPVLLDADWCSEGVLKDEEALCLDATHYGNVAREKAGFRWECLNFKDGSKLQQSFISSQNTAVSSHMPSSLKTSSDGAVVHPVNNGRILDSQSSSNVNRQKASMSSRREDLGQVGCEDVYERDIPVVSSSVEEIAIISNNHEKTSHAENPKRSASSRRNMQKFAADPVSVADCERTSNKKQVKTEVIDQSFSTSIKRQEVVEDTRHGYNRSSKNKNSRYTSGGQCKDPYKYKNGHPDVAFLEENNGIPEKEFGLKSAMLLKPDAVCKSKPTGRTSYLNVDGETVQEVSEEFGSRMFPDNYTVTREGSVQTGNGSCQYGKNGVQHSRHREHNRPSRSRESRVENNEVRMFDKPCEGFHTDSIQGCNLEYQDLPKNRSNMMSKSNKMYSGSTCHDVKKDGIYHPNDTDNYRLPKNGSNYPSVEPSIKKSTGRKVYGEGFFEPQEGSTFEEVVDYPDKRDSTSQYIEGRIDNEHGSDGNDEYYNELDSSPSLAHEMLHGRGSGTRVYYTNEHDEEKHNIRREADNSGRKSVNRKCYGVANASQQVDNEEQHETYYSVQETLYEINKGNLNSFGRAPYESQKHGDKGEQKRNYPFRENGRSRNPVYLSSKNLYESVDHSSDEEQNIWQPNSTKEHTKYAYPLDADSKKRSDVAWQTQEGKPQYGRKGSRDSPKFHGDHVSQHPELQDYHFQKSESLGLYMNETHITGSKSERRHLDSSHWESSSINDNSTLPEHKRVYSDEREKFASGLKDVHQIDKFENVNRYHRTQSERKQKVPIPSDSYVQHKEQTNSHHVSTGSNGISEGKECSPEKGRRRDIQHSKSQRTRSKQRTHESQSEGLESTSVKNFPRPPCTPAVVKRDSYATPSDRPLPHLPPSSPAPKPSYVSPEDRLDKSVNTVNEAPPPRHTVSMPSKSPARSDSLKAKLIKSSSDVGVSGTRHVHPKLPDYDDLTARFAVLKQQCQSSNSE